MWFTLLCCPDCGGELSLSEVSETAPDGHIIRGVIKCQQCEALYPITHGVPRFAAFTSEEEVERTVKGFGYQWQNANAIAENEKLSSPDLFTDFIAPIKPDYFEDKVVLDAGCGQARFAKLAQQFGAKWVVGVDLSESVTAAFDNIRSLPNVLIIQADLFNLPLGRQFDYVYSVGVLHHTSDPRRAFASITRVVKQGGGVSAWVYGRENNGWIIHVLNPIRNHITSRLPRPVLRFMSYILAVPLFLLIRWIYLPVNRHQRLTSLRKFLFYYDYLIWLGQHCGFREQALVIFDHLVPAIAHYIPRDEFAEWFSQNHLSQVEITSRANNSWRGFGIAM